MQVLLSGSLDQMKEVIDPDESAGYHHIDGEKKRNREPLVHTDSICCILAVFLEDRR